VKKVPEIVQFQHKLKRVKYKSEATSVKYKIGDEYLIFHKQLVKKWDMLPEIV
jgi:hypothetical protein